MKIIDELGYGKVCARLVPQMLSHTQEDKESNKHWSFATYNNGS